MYLRFLSVALLTITAGNMTIWGQTPATAKEYLDRGNAFSNKGDFDSAIADYTQVIRLAPNIDVVYYNRGNAYNNKDDYDRAIADYDQAIRLNPNYADAYNNRGYAYHCKENYDRAIANYDQAIRLNPNNASAFNNRGFTYYCKEDYDRAIADFNQAIRVNPNYSSIYTNRGLAYYKKGDYDRAIADYETALKINPNDVRAKGGLVLAKNLRGHSMINVKEYSKFFLNGAGLLARKYDEATTDNDYNKFAVLGGRNDVIDTPLEIALLSMCAGVIDIRPPEADEILPKNNPKLADQKLGAAVFQEIQILRFLGDTVAVSRHEAMLKWITDRKNATRQEIEAFYRDNVRALIAGVVDEEFNKISFRLDTNRAVSYGADLIYNQQNSQYVLSYGGVETNGEIRIITGNSVDALLAEMRNGKNKADFTQFSIDQVKAQAALIPAVKLSDVALNEIKTILTNFYTTPNANTYAELLNIHILYNNRALRSGGNPTFRAITDEYTRSLYELNFALGDKVLTDTATQTTPHRLSADQQTRLTALR